MKKITALLEKAEAVIFDLDGVLVDTAVFHYQAWKRLADELGIPFDIEKNEALKGISRMDSLDKILAWGEVQKTDAEKQQLAERKNEWYLELLDTMKTGDVLPGTIALLSWLKDNHKKIALGSASKNAPAILEKTGIIEYFDAVIDGNSVSRSKPDPQVFLLGAEKLGADPANCVVFEDAQSGIEAAIAAGMQVVAVDKDAVLRDYDERVNSLVEAI
ncbi:MULTISPECIES: beta-phosphoglucomutase [Sphingobacterium]|uniref:Beta-phosphoglucomutase n=1 Tax=Sphingobacterium tenebrionis TaxID=3111775 RepID=A0ABU8I7G0_9SPHI|nr:beta-phosphoglucomutase [Sphingobacterium sp. CZ-2]QBR12118.1 beta-phosphoglucomutase [Sphingobacterium sp. CZ-2]